VVKVTLSDKGATFETELDELLKIVEIIKGQLQRKHQKELKKLLNEIEKIYDVIVHDTNEFYISADGPQFKDEFTYWVVQPFFGESFNTSSLKIQSQFLSSSFY
jgi:hypothetical protein